MLRLVRKLRHYAGLIKIRMMYCLLKIYPKFWYTSKYYAQDCGGFEYFKLGGEDIIDKFYIVLKMAGLESGMRVLDVGCGRGEFCLLSQLQGAVPLGVDFSAQAIKEAKSNFNGIEFICTDILKYRPNAKFKRVFMLDFIEHVKRAYFAKILKECFELLADDGLVIIHTPESSQESYSGIPFHPEHINLMSVKELRVFLERNGFKVTSLYVLPRYSPGYSGGMFCIAQKSRPDNGASKTLIRYYASLGDTVCLTAVIREYKNKYPQEELYVASYSPGIFYYNRHIENTLEMVRTNKFTKIFDLKWKAFPETRARHITDNLAYQMGLHDFYESQRSPEISICKYEQEIFERKFILPVSQPVVVFAPYSLWASRNWIDNRWRIVGRHLIQKYNAYIIQVGTTNDPYLGIGNNWLGLTDIRMLSVLLSKAEFVVSVDTAIPHIAAAFNKPSIVLFGPVNPDLRGYRGITHPVVSASGCQGCYHDLTWPSDNPPHLCPKETYECMKNISVEQVVYSVDRLMESRGHSR